jgi:anti-anti-sigma regulatory factor
MADGPPPPVEVIEAAGFTRLVLRDGVDLSAVRDVWDGARQALVRNLPVAVDCGEAGFLDTAVTQTLLVLRRACRARGLDWSIGGVSPEVRTYLRLAGLETELLPTT